jgi:hypothetical protein
MSKSNNLPGRRSLRPAEQVFESSSHVAAKISVQVIECN